jgi:hypothetical protein
MPKVGVWLIHRCDWYTGKYGILAFSQLELTEGFDAKLLTKFLLNDWAQQDADILAFGSQRCTSRFWLTCGSQWNHVASICASASVIRFVATGAIDPKLCTYVPLGKSNSQTKFRPSLILGHQWAKTESIKSAITPELMAGSSPN